MFISKHNSFDDEALIQYASGLGEILSWDFGKIMHMHYRQDAENYLFSSEAVPFHWDGAFYREPKLLLFYCTESEGEGGETLFSNTEEIYRSLTDAEKELCEKITLTYRTEKKAHYGGTISVPLVQKHPVSGSPILRMAEAVETALNPVSLEITGTTSPDRFYSWMKSKLYDEEFLTSHSWEKGDLLICDNFTYLHGRRPLGNNRSRSFKRIQIL